MTEKKLHLNLREGFYAHNVKDTTKQIRYQLDNIDRFIENNSTEHFSEFIDWIETCTKHLRYMTCEEHL